MVPFATKLQPIVGCSLTIVNDTLIFYSLRLKADAHCFVILARSLNQLSKRETTALPSLLDCLILFFSHLAIRRLLMSTFKSFAMYCRLAAGLLALLLLGGSATNSPSVNVPSEYLRSEIQKHPPVSGQLTPYYLNGPFGGDITRLARFGQTNTVVAGTSRGEIFRSIDGGASWNQASMKSRGGVNHITCVGDLLFAATDDGIFRSADGGASWNRVAVPADSQLKEHQLLPVSKVLLHKNQLLAATNLGLFSSDLSGQSWSEVIPTSIPPSESLDSAKSGFPSLNGLATSGNQVLVSHGTAVWASENLRSWSSADRGLNLGAANSNLSNLVAVGGFFYGIRSDSDDADRLYRKASEGVNWTPVPIAEMGNAPEPTRTSATEDLLFIITDRAIRSLNHDTTDDLGLPQPGLKVNDLIQLGDSVLAATEQGIYIRKSGVWKSSNDGIRGSRKPGRLVLADKFRFAVIGKELFRSKEGSESWTSMSEEFSRQGLGPEDATTVMDVTPFRSWLFVSTYEGLFVGKIEGGGLVRTAPVKFEPGGESRSFGRLTSTDDYLFASLPSSTYRTGDNGKTWEEISFGEEIRGVLALERAGDTLFLSELAASYSYSSDVFRLRKGLTTWEKINTGAQTPVTAFAAVGNSIYATASNRDLPESHALFRPQLFKLEHSTDSKWEILNAAGLEGEVHSLWIDPTHPEVILAGTSRGLFWSNDGGQQFTKSAAEPGGASFSKVGSLAYREGQLFASTDTGVYYIYDQIPRGKWYATWVEVFQENRWVFSGSALVILLLIVLSTRLISLLLQLDVLGINQIASAFYLLPFGRWKLYRRYRGRLRRAEGLAEDLKYGVEHYVDTPFEIDGELIEGKLSEFFMQQPLTKRVILDADGGRGKSALCHYLARRCVNEGDLFGGKHLMPVVIDGLTYTGDLLNAISNALQEDHAYVNKTIVASQAAAGNLLVVFDGFSEVRESYLEAASSADLPEFIKRHPDTPFIFTSRSKLPPGVLQALKDTLTINLRNVDETTERVFLSQYLKRGEQDVDALMNEIKTRFNDLPRIPLMLKLIATIYDKKARVPKDRATLFADYAEQVLRPDATGIDYPRGLHFAIRHLVRETYLRSGGDRGFTEDRAVDLLREIKDQLEAREIKLSPIRLLQLLTRTGLYKQVGENLKFFHDSFESYFGARALENDFRDDRHELIKECAGNPRLAETWRFLSEILEETDEKGELDSLAQDSLDQMSKAAYLKSQRDLGVDYYLQLSGKGNGYAGEMYSAGGQQSIHIKLTPDSLATLGRDLRLEMGRLSHALGSSEGKTNLALNEYLPHMARLGNYAFKQIFSNTALLETIQKLRSPDQKASIQVAADSFFFPWELIYPVELNDTLSYEHFWGMNHVISHLIIQDPRHDIVGVANTPSGRPKVGLLADENIDHVAEKEILFFRMLAKSKRIDLEMFSPNHSEDRRARVHHVRAFFAKSFDIIHFACNVSYNKTTPDDSTIDLGHKWQLKLSDIEFYDLAIRGNPLIVMNTCESGNLDPLKVSGFAPTFLKRGARGVVATESDIPVATAGAFSELLYEHLLAGDTLGESLLAVRRTLWQKEQNPVGLLYSMYSPPSLIIQIK